MTLDTSIGGAASDSYVTLAEYQAYGAGRGWTLADDAADEVNLRRAAQVIDAQNSFVGMPQYQTQALSWPRLWAGYVEGWPIDPDTIPQKIKDAQCEMAYLIQGGADPMATVEGLVKSKRSKVGPLEKDVEYQGGLGLPKFTAVTSLLRDYVSAGGNNARLVRS